MNVHKRIISGAICFEYKPGNFKIHNNAKGMIVFVYNKMFPSK